MQTVNTSRLPAPARLAGGFLVLLLAAVAFLLQCHELSDADVWSHAAAGRWMLDHGGVPDQDPFGFGPDSGAWLDIDWGFQLLLAWAHAAGDIPGVILLAAGIAAAVVLIAVGGGRSSWPMAASILCWLPALLLMSWRFGPRPETFSLLFVAGYLVVLERLDERPALAWILPGVQLLWVNTSALFILGPALFLLYFLGLPGRFLMHRSSSVALKTGGARRRHVGGAFLAVLAACLVNPYFVRVFPTALAMLAKLAVPGNFYKEYVKPYFLEFMSLRDYFDWRTPALAGAEWYARAWYFLALALPLSFLYPAMARAEKAQSASTTPPRKAPPAKAPPAKTQSKTPPPLSSVAWIIWLVVSLALLAGAALALPAHPAYTRAIAGMLFLQSAVGAVKLIGRSWSAAKLAFIGGIAMAAGLVCIHTNLAGQKGSVLAQTMLVLALVAGAVSLFLVLRWGGSLFRVLVAIAFAYLGWQALRNISLFAVIAGVVLSWNVSEWLAEMRGEGRGARGESSRPSPLVPRPLLWAAWGLRGALAAALVLWGVATAGGRFFGLSEEPGFAHDAVRFAGQAGLPDNTVVYELRHAGLVAFHTGSEHKTLMDGRLTLQRRRNFTAYVDVNGWLNKHDRRWAIGLEELGNPSLVIAHRGNDRAEAAVLAHADWRLVYYDPIAAVFVPRSYRELERAYPTVDFAARHFRPHEAAPSPVRPLAEMNDLHQLAVAVKDFPEASWKWRIPLLLNALDRAPAALEKQPLAAWTLLGSCYWDMMPDLKARPANPRDDWDPARGLPWAQASYCFRRALGLNANDLPTLSALSGSFMFRDMKDAEETIARQLAGQEARAPVQPGNLDQVSPEDLFAALSELLKRSFPEACVDLFEKASRQRPFELTWKFAERIAPVYLHLGRPVAARQLWKEAANAPSEALRVARVASTHWIERDFATALGLYRQAVKQDPKLGEAHWGLAMLLTQVGQAAPALRACRHGLDTQLTERQRADLVGLQGMLARANLK